MYVEAYETLSHQSKFLKYALFCPVCNRSVYIISVKTDKAVTQHKQDNYSLQTKTQKPADKCIPKARETGEFVALAIVLRFLLVNKKWS